MFTSKVYNGLKVGRTIGFPTANLDPSSIKSTIKQGVYSSWVYIQARQYKGALYYGPRLVFDETKTVLEIYIINFSGDLYGREIQFTIESFVRPPKDFVSLDDLTVQLKKDTNDVEQSLSNVA